MNFKYHGCEISISETNGKHQITIFKNGDNVANYKYNGTLESAENNAKFIAVMF